MSDWKIDKSTGTPILVFRDCSVIESEQAEYLMRLIAADVMPQPIDMILYCPACGTQHIDAPEHWGGEVKVHRSHLCVPAAGGCGHIWRPADVPTNGVSAIATRGKDDSDLPTVPLTDRIKASSTLPPMDSDLAQILGRMCFECIQIAQVLRTTGMTIDHKAESEQAAVIYWLLGFYFEYGAEWRTAAKNAVETYRANFAATLRESGVN